MNDVQVGVCRIEHHDNDLSTTYVVTPWGTITERSMGRRPRLSAVRR